MADWLYPYNEAHHHETVGAALSFFKRPSLEETWYLTTAFKQIQLGDTIWVYGSEPYRRVIGVGTVIREPELTAVDGEWSHWFGIAWNSKASKKLATSSPEGLVQGPLRTVRAATPAQLSVLRSSLEDTYIGVATNAGRLTRTATTTYRPGQAAFRDAVIRAYGGRCAISGCSDPRALEAAHILPHNGKSTDIVTNGLLLRADLHRLWDRYLVGIDANFNVVVHSNVEDPSYRRMKGKAVRIPKERSAQPSKSNLQEHLRLVQGP